jgi:hypothetical protein
MGTSNGSRRVRAPLETRVTNEFASVRVKKIWTGAGTRLRLYSERTDQTVEIDATGLEALCWLTPEAISNLVTVVSERGREAQEKH